MPPTKGRGAKQPPPPETPVTTGGGGDDDGDSVVSPAIPHTELGPAGKSRKAFVKHEDFEFVPESLVGSWFHRLENGTMVWQGVIVAEPSQGVYLVQIDKESPGAANTQRLVPLSQMTNDDEGYEWRFYDSEELARNGYANWVSVNPEHV